MAEQHQTEAIIAFAVDQEECLTNKHFGQAQAYAVYRCGDHHCQYVRTIPNHSVSEETHGAAGKARSVMAQLREEDNVNVVVSRRFGPNIQRIRRVVLPVITTASHVTTAMFQLQRSWAVVKESLQAEVSERRHLLVTGAPNNAETSKISAVIAKDDCTGCRRCVTGCPTGALTLAAEKADVTSELCVGCGACVSCCPNEAVKLRPSRT